MNLNKLVEASPLVAITAFAIARHLAKSNSLENVMGSSQLAWVKSNNKDVEERIGDPRDDPMYDKVLAVFNSKDKIAYVEKIGDYYYNFWKDDKHIQGLLRKTTLESYKTESPAWESVLDVDKLAKVDKVTWVYKGKKVLYVGPNSPHNNTRCLISLSKGGADAVEIREFDLLTKTFVSKEKGGFFVPECKSRVSWRDQDTIFIGTKIVEDDLTDSGYPRTVRKWKRGTPLGSSTIVYEGEKSKYKIGNTFCEYDSDSNNSHNAHHIGDVSVTGYFSQAHGYQYEVVHRAITFYEYEYFVREVSSNYAQEDFVKLEIPKKCSATLFGDKLILELKEDWKVFDKHLIMKGSLVSFAYRKFVAGNLDDMHVLFEPTRSTSLESYTFTKSILCLSILDNVKCKRVFYAYTKDQSGMSWNRLGRDTDQPSMETLSCWEHDFHGDDFLWVSKTGFITPSTISLVNALQLAHMGESIEPVVTKKSPTFFNASGLVVSQHFCDSVDGTRIPYFQIARKDLTLDGSNPTLLYGYGGFEISMLPYYSATRGIGWFEDGGVWIVANIRGGGEYSDWHQSVLKENRYKAYEDFESVARDLIKRGVTSSKRLGIMGGSNGGLLVGNAMTRYPELYEAVVCMVPLLDMKRYTKLLAGASWIAEYGDPDSEEVWDSYLKNHSPFHRLLCFPKSKYPHALFTTSTRDDRVHPAHARKMVKRLIELGHSKTTYYYENIEGGHGGAANYPQTAYLWTLVFMFLRQKLKLGEA